jgi:hypothetical protein
MVQQGILYVAKFDYRNITKSMLDDVIGVSERRKYT